MATLKNVSSKSKGQTRWLTRLVCFGMVGLNVGGDTMIVNVSEAKTNLSKLINLAFQGEEVIIAKNNLPLVELVVYKPKSKIVFGLLSTKDNDPLDNDIMDETEEVNDLFYNHEISPK